MFSQKCSDFLLQKEVAANPPQKELPFQQKNELDPHKEATFFLIHGRQFRGQTTIRQLARRKLFIYEGTTEVTSVWGT